MTLQDNLTVWVGALGVYRVPAHVVKRAELVNGGRRLFDKRTRGFKALAQWGAEMDRKELDKHDH